MGKPRETWSYELYRRYIREGRGQGEGANYKPWINTHNVPSLGIISRVQGQKTGRMHSYLSRNELQFHYILEAEPRVTDIREQYPLRLKDTLRIADRLDIRHPIVNGFPVVMTTDFLITADQKLYARTVKMTKDLSNPRVLDKFRIEAAFWQEKGIDWKIVTERQINPVKASNIEWMYSGENIERVIPDADVRQQFLAMFMSLYLDRNVSFRDCIERTERFFQCNPGTAICAFKQLIRDGVITVDMNRRFMLGDPRSED